MDHDEVRAAVLERVVPSDEERQSSEELFDRIRSRIEEEHGREAELMGSTAKGTFMAGDKDLDIFVFFDTTVPEEELEEAGLAIGEDVFDAFDGDCEVEYAEHPYTKGRIDDYEVEIVPAYRVDSGEDIRSSVDRTPFHRDWVNEHLSTDEKEEVVLLKAFLRGQELYGSSLRVQGFSGYLCELLIAEYGTMEALLEAAVDWDEAEVIDPADHHDGLPARLRERFEDDALVVIDPVDQDRNVASVLSAENHARFVYAAWRYRQDPDQEFFFPETEETDKARLEAAAEERGDFVTVAFPTPDRIDDILYPQLRRLQRRLETELEENEFRILQSGFHVGDGEVRMVVELFSQELPATRRHVGPKVFHNVEHVENFTDAYDDVWVDGTRLTTIVEREHSDARDLLQAFLDGDLRAQGVPDGLAPAVAEAEVTGLVVDTDDYCTFLRDEFHLGGGQ